MALRLTLAVLTVLKPVAAQPSPALTLWWTAVGALASLAHVLGGSGTGSG